MSNLNIGLTGFSSSSAPSIGPSEWSISDFKAIGHASLNFPRLTILTGSNSSGKSSLIQSLLLLAQSVEEEIILNGPLVRLGGPSEMIRSGREQTRFSYTISIGSGDTSEEWSLETTLGPGKTGLEVKDFNVAADGVHVLSATSDRVTEAVRHDVNQSGKFGDSLLRVTEVRSKRALSRTYLTFDGLFPESLVIRRKRDRILSDLRRSYNRTRITNSPEILYRLFDHLHPWWRAHNQELPPEIVSSYGKYFESRSGRMLRSLRSENLGSLFEVYAEIAEQEKWLAVPLNRNWGRYGDSGLYGQPLFGVPEAYSKSARGIALATDGLKKLGRSIRYLGPLREEPQVVSVTGGRNRNLPLGSKGEYTADVLTRDRNKTVWYRDWRSDPIFGKFSTAVGSWSEYLGIGDSVTVVDQGKLGRGLLLKINGVPRDLTMVGVGASQLLPVIALVLAADPGDVVCIEQPELHLHPAVQSRLADFFLYARPDISLIIETHSEYMITRTRRRIVENPEDLEYIAIYFAEQHKGVTEFRPLRMNSFGDLAEWPEGFFDTQDNEARELVRAIAERESNLRDTSN